MRSAQQASSDRQPRRFVVFGFCRLTGPWREIVLAKTAAGALAKYCAEHAMEPAACHVQPA